MNRRRSVLTCSLVMLVVCATSAASARADCSALLAALEKADREPRFALYDLESREQPLTGKPVLVRIGKVVFDGFGGDYERHDTDGTNPVLAQLRKAQRAGTARCAAAGTDTWRQGVAVNKIEFDNPLAPKSANPTTFWVSRVSGLPVYHEIANLGPGGYGWQFGEAVKEPRMNKVR
jgi:hypothetical protein